MFGFEFIPRSMESDPATLASLYALARENQAALQSGSQDSSDTNRAQRAQIGGAPLSVIIPHNPRGRASVDSLLAAQMLRGLEIQNMRLVPTLSGALGAKELEARLLGVKYGGFQAVALIGGDSQNGKGMSGEKLIALAREILGADVELISGIGSLEHKANREILSRKLRAGVDTLITQPLFSTRALEANVRAFEESGAQGVRLCIGLLGIFESSTAHAINAARLGFEVPLSYIAQMESTGEAHATALFYELLTQMSAAARALHTTLYLCSAKPNDLRIYAFSQT